MNLGVVVKVSKLCNLRCTYCNEGPDLANRTRMELGQLRAMFRHLRGFVEGGPQERHELTFYWHGGEPFAQPIAYWEEVLACQEEVFGGPFVRDCVINAVQSNITLLTERHLPLLRRFRVGFSFDVINSLRVNLAGKPTAKRVRQQVDFLLASGVPLAGIVVVSRGNVDRPADVANYFLSHDLAFRVTHLDERADELPAVRDSAVPFPAYLGFLAALLGLPEVRQAMQAGFRLDPLTQAADKLALHRTGYKTPWSEQECWEGEQLLEVDTNGDVYSPADYPSGRAYGNLFTQPLEELLLSPARSERIRRSAERMTRVCGSCALYRRGCNGALVSHATASQYREFEEAGGCYLRHTVRLMEDSGTWP